MDIQKALMKAKAIILHPHETWAEVKSEVTTVEAFFREYIMILAAIPPLATFLGYWIFGVPRPFHGTYHVSFFRGLIFAVVSYALSLLVVYLLAYIVDWLAPRFEAKNDRLSALKVVAYSLTPMWLAGIFMLIPALSPLSILGLYGLYLLYIGLPYLMDCPPQKALLYTLATVVAGFLLNIIVGAITGSILAIPSSGL